MSAGLKLWEVADALQAIGERIAEAGGELTPELEAELDAMEGAFEEKVERVALFIRQCEVNGIAAATEQERLGAIRRSYESKMHGLKNYLLAAMTKAGHQAVRTPRVRVWTQANGRPSIRFGGDVEKLPGEYRRVSVAVDTQRAYEEWLAGRELPAGFVVTESNHIRIK